MDWNEQAGGQKPAQATPQVVAGSDPGEERDFDILLCLRVLLSYWWIMAPLAVLSAGVGMYISMRAQPVFRATCRFEVSQNQLLQIGEDNTSARSDIGRHLLILRGQNLNNKIRQQLAAKDMAVPAQFERFRLDVDPVKESPQSMLDIRVDSYSREHALEYLLALLEGYRKLRLEETTLMNENTLSSLRREQKSLSAQLEDTQNALAKFEAEHNIQYAKEKARSDQTLLSNIMHRQSQLRTQLAILDAQFPFLTRENAATLQDVLQLTIQLSQMSGMSGRIEGDAMVAEQQAGWSDIPQWRDNEAKIIRLTAEYKEQLKKFKPGHPTMVALQNEIDSAKRELTISAQISLKRLKSIRTALKMQEDALLESAQASQMSMDLTARQRAEYEKLKSRAEHLKMLHDKVFSRIIDNTSSTVDKYYSRIVDGPFAMPEPVWPVKWKILTLSILGITGSGAALILIIYFIKVRLYNLQAIERALNLTCLAGIPKFANVKMRKKRPLDSVILLDKRNDVASECYRSLRTNIEQRLGDNRMILVTSPDPGEGKTFTALNLAVVFAWNHPKVLIIDCDFRRVTLRRYFPDASNDGLMDCLGDESLKWQDMVVKNAIDNLDYLPAGHTTNQATELLTLGRLEATLEEISKEYDVVVLDTAPVNRVVDTILLGQHAGAVVLVARAGKTTSHSLRYCFSRLGGANIAGYILNRIDSSARKYGYYSGMNYSPYYQYRSYYRAAPSKSAK